MASLHLNWEQSFYFGGSSAQGAIGSASESSYYSPTGGVFAITTPSGDGKKKRKKDMSSLVKLRSFTPHYDGHMWRKYGQKKIKDANYDRLYYRCTYFGDKQCLASKHIQQLTAAGDEPALHEVTYIHEHTCGASPVPIPNLVAEQQTPTTRIEGGLLLRFDSAASHRDKLVRQQGQFYQSVPPSPFTVMNFGPTSQMHYQQPVSHSHYDLGAPASTSFPTKALLPPTNYSDDDLILTSILESFNFDDHIEGVNAY